MCPTHVDKKVTHRARPPRRKRRLGDLMDSTEIQRVTGVFSRIDSNKYYTRQEVGGYLNFQEEQLNSCVIVREQRILVFLKLLTKEVEYG